MSVSVADLRQAALEGRRSAPGTANPYAGKPILARAWRTGYKRMLLAMLDSAPEYRAYLAAQKETPRP